MKSFMKATVFFLSLNTILAGASYAQEVNYDEINSKGSAIDSSVSSGKVSFKNKSIKVIKSVDSLLKIEETFKRKFPEKRKLVGVDKKIKKLLSCNRKMASKSLGGVAGAELIARSLDDLIEDGVLLSDTFSLDKAILNCSVARKKLKKIRITKRHFEDLESLIDSLSVDPKIKRIVKDFYIPYEVICEKKNLTAKIAGLLGVEVGASYARCLMSDGMVQNYFGIVLGGGFGIGAEVNYTRQINGINNAGKSFYYGASETPMRDGEIFVTLGPIVKLPEGSGPRQYHSENQVHENRHSMDGKDSSRVGLGLGFFGMSNMTLAAKLLPNTNRWSYLIDKLK